MRERQIDARIKNFKKKRGRRTAVVHYRGATSLHLTPQGGLAGGRCSGREWTRLLLRQEGRASLMCLHLLHDYSRHANELKVDEGRTLILSAFDKCFSLHRVFKTLKTTSCCNVRVKSQIHKQIRVLGHCCISTENLNKGTVNHKKVKRQVKRIKLWCVNDLQIQTKQPDRQTVSQFVMLTAEKRPQKGSGSTVRDLSPWAAEVKLREKQTKPHPEIRGHLLRRRGVEHRLHNSLWYGAT